MASHALPLAGVRVVEMEGIGPGPLGACVLADFGADVVSVSQVGRRGQVLSKADPVSRGKRSIALNLKSPEGHAAFCRIAAQADVLIEPYRPGVMEKLGLGPDVLTAANPRLIYARMTGWGQGGDEKISKSAGHDANYISIAGTLDLFRRGDESPSPPANFAGDYAGGGMMLAMGVLLAVIERATSGRGQVIDVAMIDGANYVALPLFKWMQTGFVPTRPDGSGHLDAPRSVLNQAPYWVTIYKCADGEYVSVQSIEPPFFKLMMQGIGLASRDEETGKIVRACRARKRGRGGAGEGSRGGEPGRGEREG
jgi:alpha-methylacyl-CoA racemase